MSQENVQIVRTAYEDFNSGNIPAVLGRLDSGVEWNEPGGGRAPSGTFRGPEGVGNDVFAMVSENFDEFAAEPEEFRDQGERVVVIGRFTGKAKSGIVLNAGFEHVHDLRDGKIVRFHNMVDAEAWARGWS